MIIIPEKEIVIITPPRTGSTTLLVACKMQYPNTMSLYRHMEADGIPLGYDRWRRVGMVRDPAARLVSLYNYLCGLNPKVSAWHHWQHHIASSNPFQYWLTDMSVPFTNPDWLEGVNFNPRQRVLHSGPEQRKSQWVYVRPDLGVEPIVVGSKAFTKLMRDLELPRIPVMNQSSHKAVPFTDECVEHIEKCHSWDIDTVRRALVG